MNRALIPLLICLLIAVPGAAIIKVGNTLEIQVVGHDEFSGKFQVNDNGTIDYPLLADMPVANSSTSELMNDLTLRLARHIDNPLVLVSVVNKPEMVITVLGQVARPGPIVTYPDASLQEVLFQAGGVIPETADIRSIRIFHKTSQPANEWGDLKNFFLEADPAKLPRLYPQDVVVVPSQPRTGKIKVIGAVQKPGVFSLEAKTNLFEMIYLAGGPAEKADLSRVRKISVHEGTTTEEVINVQGYIDKGQITSVPEVIEGDVIIVYTKWFDGKTVMSILTNTLLLIVTLQAFGGIFK